jgi:hypothetical protein
MLVAMKKIDGELLDDLHYRFHELDPSGDGLITKKDLVIMAKRKRQKVRNKLMLREYKASHFSTLRRIYIQTSHICANHAFG